MYTISYDFVVWFLYYVIMLNFVNYIVKKYYKKYRCLVIIELLFSNNLHINYIIQNQYLALKKKLLLFIVYFILVKSTTFVCIYCFYVYSCFLSSCQKCNRSFLFIMYVQQRIVTNHEWITFKLFNYSKHIPTYCILNVKKMFLCFHQLYFMFSVAIPCVLFFPLIIEINEINFIYVSV